MKKLTSATLFAIPSYTYVTNMGTLSQNMPREWAYLSHLVWNLYMLIDDRPFCEVSIWKVCRKSSLSFILWTSTHNRTPCQVISFFEVFFMFFEFFKKLTKWLAWLLVERGRILQNYWRFYEIITTCVPWNDFKKNSEQTITYL